MAYASVISLKHTIRRFVNSSQIPLVFPDKASLLSTYDEASSLEKLLLQLSWLVDCYQLSFLNRSSRDILEFVYRVVSSLQELLQQLGSSSERANAVNGQIREAVGGLEYALESYESDQFLSQNDESLGDKQGGCSLINLSLDLAKEVKQEIHSFTEKVKKIVEDQDKNEDLESSNSLPKANVAVKSGIGFDGKKSKMVGLSDEFSKIKGLLTKSQRDSPEINVISLVGMAGIGKSTLAMKILKDQSVANHFDLHAFVTIGPENYQLKEIILSILAQMNHDIDKINTYGDDELAEYLCTHLQGRRYLVVMDDIWNNGIWDHFRKALPNENNGSRVLLTTRLHEVAENANSSVVHRMRFMNEKESWFLLREVVFGEDQSCPFELEKPGKKIAENCEGLPLAILSVGRSLSKTKKTLEYWNKVAETDNAELLGADDEMLDILHLSYKYLPQHLKGSFLYMGVFPAKYEFQTSKLINMWFAERLLEPDSSGKLEELAAKHLVDLVSKSVVLIRKESYNFGIKICAIHCVFWYLCVREARKEKFFHVINSKASGCCAESMESQRRLCIHKNVLFAVQEVYDSMKHVSTTHSLLCTGPYHGYPVPICFDFRLLRVAHALTIRFYQFPVEVLKLVHLTYLALNYNGLLPASISKLCNLEYLIVHQNLSSAARSYLPMEIWHMKRLKFLQVMGSYLPKPDPSCGHDIALLPNLFTLLDVSTSNCTHEILLRIPNLKKLGIQIELQPDDVEALPRFDYIMHLTRLESLKYILVNPYMNSEIVSPPVTTSFFPHNVQKLSLSGLRHPWENVWMISTMPNLRVLKLRCYAFQGPKWEAYHGQFYNLQYLLLEDMDLVHWTMSDYCFRSLQSLVIRHCYKLKGIFEGTKDIPSTLKTIELVDCPSAVASVKLLEEEQLRQGNQLLQVCIQSSWID